MKLARSKNALKYIKVGLINKIITLLGPFVVRTVFIRTLGAEYLGVNSLFTSVLSVLSLAELGFSGAIVFNMYKAIADDDTDKINALLAFYRKVYRYVGLIILGIGLLLIPFLPHLVHGSYPDDINPIVVYLVFLGNTVLSYFLFAYLNSLLYAFQRADVDALIGVYMAIAMYALQIVLLLTVKNYYVYLAIMPIFTVLTNIRTAVVTKKMFPQYKPFGKLSKEVKSDIKEKVGGLMIQKLCQTSRNAFDSIFISMFLGLTEIAIYNNYYYVMSFVIGIMSIVSTAVTAGAGNSIATETQQKNHQDMMRLNFVYMWISGWCTVCMLCLYQQFMEIWVGKELMLQMSSVILICIYFYIMKMGDVRYIYNEAAGLWWQGRFRAIAESVANIALNYFLGKYFGINGIIAATIISLFFINFCYGSQILYKYYFTEIKMRYYFLYHLVYAGVTTIIIAITLLSCYFIPNTWWGFGVRIPICTFLPNILYFLIYRRTKIYRESMPWILTRVNIREKSLFWKILIKR